MNSCNVLKEQTYAPGPHSQQDAMLAGHLTHICPTAPANSGPTTGPLHQLAASVCEVLPPESPRGLFHANVRSWLHCLHLREAFCWPLLQGKLSYLPGHHIIHFLQNKYHHWNHVYVPFVYLSSLLNRQLSGIRDLIHLACHTLTGTQTNTGTEQLAETFTVWLKNPAVLSTPTLILEAQQLKRWKQFQNGVHIFREKNLLISQMFPEHSNWKTDI